MRKNEIVLSKLSEFRITIIIFESIILIFIKSWFEFFYKIKNILFIPTKHKIKFVSISFSKFFDFSLEK